jgi:integral membrane protein
MSPRRLFRVLSVVEAVTWTLLIVGMLLKYAVGVGDWPVSVAGPIHGFAFLAYGAAALVLSVNQRWSAGATVLAVASAVIPYATIPLERGFERRGLLEGGWRRVAGEDPRDRRVTSRLLRWALVRPVLAGALVLAAVAVVFTALLIVGPPGGGKA